MTGALLFIAAGCGHEPREQPAMADLVQRDIVAVHEWVNASSGEPAVLPDRSGQIDPVSDMLTGLEARLSQQPDDRKGWSLLAQSYAYVGRMSDANAAIDRAVALGADRAGLERRVLAAHGEGN